MTPSRSSSVATTTGGPSRPHSARKSTASGKNNPGASTTKLSGSSRWDSSAWVCSTAMSFACSGTTSRNGSGLNSQRRLQAASLLASRPNPPRNKHNISSGSRARNSPSSPIINRPKSSSPAHRKYPPFKRSSTSTRKV